MNPFHMTDEQIAAKTAAIEAEKARIAALPESVRQRIANVQRLHACNNAFEVIAESEATVII